MIGKAERVMIDDSHPDRARPVLATDETERCLLPDLGRLEDRLTDGLRRIPWRCAATFAEKCANSPKGGIITWAPLCTWQASKHRAPGAAALDKPTHGASDEPCGRSFRGDGVPLPH
jgi:hypothetical protein